MNFSPSYPCSNGSVSWSPNGRYILSSTSSRLILRDASSLCVLSNYVCSEPPDQIFWAPNSELFGVLILGRGLTRVFRVKDPEWTARIAEGSFLRRFLAVLEAANKGREVLSIYDSEEGWQILRSIELPTLNASGLSWSRKTTL
ncbi:Uncharacterized protein FKW44_001398 [Caligus rogercresseyi]|uniref:Uncharacterized protein n=1 Tax=Caligus rogercresseyi TaxID=217165 RepID=A0A7T8QVI7_CALRO|nr:Uncharacterized protein FKW44_001398 [Caligus rogercresseyi]